MIVNNARSAIHATAQNYGPVAFFHVTRLKGGKAVIIARVQIRYVVGSVIACLLAMQSIGIVMADGGLVSMHNDGFGIQGTIVHYPLVRLIFWGSEWANGWVDNDTSNPYGMGSAKAEAYITNFFTNMGSPPVGGATWHHIFENQYCQGVPAGTIHCGYPNPNPNVVFISGMSGVLNTIVDNVAVPQFPAVSDVASEAAKIAANYSYDPRVLYMLFPPTHKYVNAYPCTLGPGYGHDSVNTSSGTIAFGFIEYPDVAGCRHLVNATDDSLGHGYYDKYSITSAHEWAEMVTDQFGFSWFNNSPSTGEVADMCPGSDPTNYLNFAWYGGYDHFAAQRIWTNEWQGTGGCAYR